MLAIITTLSTAVGIGACSLIFALANFALFRPLPVHSPATLMSITGGNGKTGEVGNTISYPEFLDIGKAPSLQSVAAYFPMMPGAVSRNGSESRRYWGSIASANYFDVVRSGLLLGRGFNPALDDAPGGAPVMVISHRLWTSFFAADPSILNRTVFLNGRKLTVIGVAPSGFLGTDVGLASDFWVPFSQRDLVTPFLPASKLDNFVDRDAQWLFAVARLQDGAPMERGASELRTIAQRLAVSYPATNKDRTFHVEVAGQVTPALRKAIILFFTLLMMTAALVLLTSCANVANLLIARGYARHQEIATRMALGARPLRLIRQLLTESVLLAVPGGALGCLIAYAGAHSMRSLPIPVSLPVQLGVSLDWRVLAFCAALSLLTGVVFGLAPALKLISHDHVAGLVSQFSDQHRTRWWSARNMLAVAQIAICVVLLTCAGLFFRSLQSSGSAQTGMSHRDVGMVSSDVTLLLDASKKVHSPESVLDTIQAIPGIQSAAITTSVPLSLAGVSGSVTSGDKATGGGRGRTAADIYEVSPGFFETLGIPVLAGNDFKRGQTQDDTVILNMAAAQKLFPGESAIGRQVETEAKQSLRVIGVVATSKSRTIVEDPRPCMYRPLLIDDLHSIMGITLLFRTAGDPSGYLRQVSDAIHGMDPSVALFDVKTMEEHRANALLFQRVMAFLFGATGMIGLLIAAFGIYGVISFLVARQTKEIGIRMALGASRQQVLIGVLGRGLLLTASGTLVGLSIAFLIGKVIASFLYGVTPTDATTFAIVPLLLLPFALAACAFPAFRAAAVDPLKSIRYQ